MLRQKLVYTLGTWITLGLFLVIFNPTSLPVVVLIVPFVLAFAALYNLWGFVGELRVRYFGYESRHRRLGAIVSLTIVLLMVLQSLGQLTLRDVLTVAAIVSLGYMYLGRVRLSVSRQ